MSCETKLGGVKSMVLMEPVYNKGDIKIVNGSIIVKRKYGRFNRLPIGLKPVTKITF